MKPSIGSAAFGLVPIPPMPSTSAAKDGDARHPDDRAQPAQVERPGHEPMERIATKDELARLRRELEINVEHPADELAMGRARTSPRQEHNGVGAMQIEARDERRVPGLDGHDELLGRH